MTDDIQRRRDRAVRSPSVLGYASTRSVRAGESISFFVSSEDDRPYDARVVRLYSPDIGPIGPAFRTEAIDAPLNGVHDGSRQPIRIGSWAQVVGPLPIGRAAAMTVLVQPTLTDDSTRTIAEIVGADGTSLVLDQSIAALRFRVGVGATEMAEVALPALEDRVWSAVTIGVDLDNGSATLSTRTLRATGHLEVADRTNSVDWTPGPASTLAGSSLVLAASLDGDGHLRSETCFNGKLEAPTLFATADAGGTAAAAWDFSVDMGASVIPDTGGLGLGCVLHNVPTRGTRGSTWTGEQLSWRADPSSYAAVHFHEDDLGDAGWDVSHTLDVPADLDSGCYAVRLAPADDSTPEFWVPFAVRPAAGARHRSVAYVLPTTTYGAYANMHLRVTAQFNEFAHGRLTVLDSTDFLLLTMPELGKSTYDVHRDGSPVIYSTMNRPVTNFRPTGRMYKFCLDLMITDWLDACGIEADVITDDDLHAEGDAATDGYRVLLTGSHPEYMTRATVDAFESFLHRGGRLMYLGGNGFYSAAEIPIGQPDVVEARRPGQDNLWRVNHAEGTFSSSGLPGGLWRNIGRPENALVGVGFITQGFDACTFYRRSAASHDERVSWVFDGLDPEAVIGDFGILQGGAAGYEIDRYEVAKGSPPHAVVLASSGGHSNVYDIMVPSVLDTLPDPSRTVDPIRADMVLFETIGGGAVFSVGSIAWAGSLSHDGHDNSVSRVTRNVLQRFDDPSPIAIVPA